MKLTKAKVLQVLNISKTYSTVVANDNVSLNLLEGQIHALLGENGAGKSTLVKIIYGLVKPDSGKMFLNNTTYAPENPKKARMHGVGMVFQHFSLFDALTVSQNILLGMDKSISQSSLINQIVEISTNCVVIFFENTRDLFISMASTDNLICGIPLICDFG